jgi:chaperonin GroES
LTCSTIGEYSDHTSTSWTCCTISERKLSFYIPLAMNIVKTICICLLLTVTDGFAPSTRSGNGRESSQLFVATLDGRKIKGDVSPLNNFLLVQIAGLKEKTEGGILLTGKAKIKKTEGKVVSVGPGKTHQDSGVVFDMPVSPGEGVVYGKYDGTEIELNGQKHMLIRDDDILLKFQGDELTLEASDVTRDNVLVYVERKDSATEGGILIAKSSKSENRPSTGEVVKVGPGRISADGTLMAMEVEVGDMVKFRDFAGNEVNIGDKEYSVVRMQDILAKF